MTTSNSKAILKVIIQVMAVAAIVLLILWISIVGHGVKVIVKNDYIPLTNVHLHYTGGTIKIPELRVGATFRKRIQPKGESRLAIQFVDKNGDNQTHQIHVYFERNYRGSVLVRIAPTGEVSWEDKIGI